MADDSIYDAWLADRRAVAPSRESADRVMAAIESREVRGDHCVTLADRVHESRVFRWVTCIAASVIGSLPFLFVAREFFLF